MTIITVTITITVTASRTSVGMLYIIALGGIVVVVMSAIVRYRRNYHRIQYQRGKGITETRTEHRQWQFEERTHRTRKYKRTELLIDVVEISILHRKITSIQPLLPAIVVVVVVFI